jgi:hypothetical protein
VLPGIIRDLRRAWVAVTKTSGHKTESIYRRCAIVAERDIADGLTKVAAFPEADGPGC